MNSRWIAVVAGAVVILTGAWIAMRAHLDSAKPQSDGREQRPSLWDDIHKRGRPGQGESVVGTTDGNSIDLPNAPRGVEELRELVAWLRTLSRGELLQLTNAEFGFQKSDLVDMLRTLEGEWVIPELGRLAAAENDDLIKAVLVMGLADGFAPSRTHDPRLLTEIERLLPQLSTAAMDPFDVGRALAIGASAACIAQHRDLGSILAPYLETSDNPKLLATGYLFIGVSGSSPELLSRMLTEHPSDSGRFGALEGLRQASGRAKLPPDEIARLSLGALQTETSDRNRVLLIEMMGSCGGETGLAELAEIVKSGASGIAGHAATMLAVKGDPDRAREVIDDALKSGTISCDDRGSLYQALGAIPGEESRKRLLDVAGDKSLTDVERKQALQGLWNQPMSEALSRELTDMVSSDAPGAVRAESLRMLAFGKPGESSLDTRSIAESDKDSAVRQEAVMLSAMHPGTDNRGWLEERFLNDSSPDVKAAALGSLVMQAHYGGDGESVLAHLARVRGQTTDPSLLAMIDQGEKLVRSYDPRRIDLELQRDADVYAIAARFATGPSQAAMQRQAEYYKRIVAALTTDSRR